MNRGTDAGSDAAFVPKGRLLRFPELDALRPIARPTVQERIEARLAAFYDAVDDQTVEAPLPYTTDIWLHPHDEEALRRWVEAPADEAPSEYVRQFTMWHWRVIGPSVSEHVPVGHIIVAPRGTSRRVRP